jgi:uncharacterized protein YyaL (SSP411 family)
MLTPVNRLASETSLYLRQHAENPVDWHPWGEDAFQEAHVRGVPILLSVGYSSCHWCHVMAHESFEDEAIAALMNELFVNVKVDREERPDVDALYMQATLALSGNGGWPMTVFLTPAGEPFYAGTYFPPEPRGSMPGFPDLLRAVSNAYVSRREDVNAQAEQLVERLRSTTPEPSGDGLSVGLLEQSMVGLARIFDPAQGGFAGAPKFPPSLVLDYLLRRAWTHNDRHAREMAALTLRRMAEGGIYDQLGGGFHRYSVDAVWLVPHFEKMLYDNALLARDYVLAHRVTDEQAYAQIARETLDYLLREMRVEGGAFASAQDADSPGGEGASFVWTPEQIHEALPDDQAQVALLRYGITPEGNFEGGTTVLRVAQHVDAISQQIGQPALPLLQAARSALLEERSRREAPARDDKVIASWNGLAVTAFAEAGVALERPDYVDVAAEVADFVLQRMVVDGRLMRTFQDGEALHLGQLDDYANLCQGLLALYEARFETRWFTALRELAERMIELFHDPDGGGFFYTGDDGEQLVARTRDLEDQPTPSGNSQAALALIRMSAMTGDRRLREIAEGAMRLVAPGIDRHPQAFGTALTCTGLLLDEFTEVAVIGDLDDPLTRDLVATARRAAGPDAVVASCAPGDAEAAAAVPLLADKGLVDGSPAAYVCRDFACRQPVVSPDALAAELGREEG